MIDPIVRQGTMNYKNQTFRNYCFFILFTVLFIHGERAFGSGQVFECTDGTPVNRSFLKLDLGAAENGDALLFRFRILPVMMGGGSNKNVASFLENWGILPKEFQRPVFELSLKSSQCRIIKESEGPLVDCFLNKGTKFKVRDTLTNKVEEGVLSWGQLHMRRQVETFVMFRSEDGQFKKSHERIKIFFTGQNKKREISRLESVYHGHFCYWN